MSVSANGEPWPKGITPRPSPCAFAAHGSRGVDEDPAEAIKVIVTDIGIMMRRKGAAGALHQTQQIEEIDKELKKQHQKLQLVLECRNGMVVEEAEDPEGFEALRREFNWGYPRPRGEIDQLPILKSTVPMDVIFLVSARLASHADSSQQHGIRLSATSCRGASGT